MAKGSQQTPIGRRRCWSYMTKILEEIIDKMFQKTVENTLEIKEKKELENVITKPQWMGLLR